MTEKRIRRSTGRADALTTVLRAHMLERDLTIASREGALDPVSEAYALYELAEIALDVVGTRPVRWDEEITQPIEVGALEGLRAEARAL